MNSAKLPLLALLIAVLFGFGASPISKVSAERPATPPSQRVEDLLSVAVRMLQAEHTTLVTGNSKEIEKAKIHIVEKALPKSNARILRQLNRNKVLGEHGQRYVAFDNDLILEQAEYLDDEKHIQLRFREKVRLTLDTAHGKEQVITEEETTYVIQFVFKNDVWKLSDIQTLGDPAANINEGEPDDPSIDSGTQPIRLSSGPGVPSRTKSGAQSGIYNPSAAVNYAKQYWGGGEHTCSGYNPAYRSYSAVGGDCTNFVSQTMRAGGWTFVNEFYLSNSAWWYVTDPCCGLPGQSRTWSNVRKWFKFARVSGRGFDAIYLGDFLPGDTMQQDYAHYPDPADGKLDHNMIVTKKDSEGNLFLTYHSTNCYNRLNRSFWDIYADYPDASTYGTLMWYEF